MKLQGAQYWCRCPTWASLRALQRTHPESLVLPARCPRPRSRTRSGSSRILPTHTRVLRQHGGRSALSTRPPTPHVSSATSSCGPTRSTNSRGALACAYPSAAAAAAAVVAAVQSHLDAQTSTVTLRVRVASLHCLRSSPSSSSPCAARERSSSRARTSSSMCPIAPTHKPRSSTGSPARGTPMTTRTALRCRPPAGTS
ncbi:hypothetical protein B0H15DRAFT_422261 [Mycena belliarum]|uniref:Uncharacterized protein n=1 Tax=Mycena belliarum TaxID=1033014 RepID=A0AAD6XLV4_9AGAR|nr:hypothetical protein B0H15DRAFT_422261 [Mycena belliae]